MLANILPLIPTHDQYVEPFCGGAPVYWAKAPAKREVLNDIDGNLVNFWNCLITDFDELQYLIQITLHSEATHKRAKAVLMDDESSKIQKAWAYWVRSQMSFGYVLNGGLRFSRSNEAARSLNKKIQFNYDLYTRIQNTEIFCRNAIELIQMLDSEDIFMYFDPPYAESNCGHYESQKAVYYELLKILPSLKCRWLMSSYPSETLENIWKQNSFKYVILDMYLNMGATGSERKSECLTYNYRLPNNLFQL